MAENNDIRESIKNVIAQSKVYENNLYFCDVVAIDEINKTIDCKSIKGDSDITFTVELEMQATVTPMLNTQVLIIKDKNDNSYHLLKTEKIESVVVTVNGITSISSNEIKLEAEQLAEISGHDVNLRGINVGIYGPTIKISKDDLVDSDIVLNSGSNGGIPKTPKLVQKLNTLETRMNALCEIFLFWTPALGDGGTALKTIYTPYSSILTSITPTTIAEIENENVKH